MSDVVFLDKIRENAKKLGYIYERSLDIFDFEPERKRHKNPPLYEKFTVFTKIDTEKNEEFPNDKIAVYRAFEYHAEWMNMKKNGEIFFELRYTEDGSKVSDMYIDYFKLFCGAAGFEYKNTKGVNPINTILIVILDNIRWIPEMIFPKVHKNFILFCLISTSSPHEIFIAPDLRLNNNSEYQDKINELKLLLGITKMESNE